MIQAFLNLAGYRNDRGLYYTHAGYKAEGTSQEAAAEITPTIKAAHEKLIALLTNHPKGLTSDQAGEKLGWSPFYSRPRVSELHKRGTVKKIGRATNPQTRKRVSVWGLV